MEAKFYRWNDFGCQIAFMTYKSPGNDGIPIEFYKTFWSVNSGSFIKCVNEYFEQGELLCSQKQVAITLIKKKGKGFSLENWRRIFLVSVYTKIMSKAISEKNSVLLDIIHQNQTGFHCQIKRSRFVDIFLAFRKPLIV